MLKDEVDASKGLNQSDFMLEQEIGTLSLELFVRLLLDNDHDVTGLGPRVLVSLAMERVLAVVWCTFVDLCVENFLLLDDLLALARLTLVGLIDDLTLTATVVTGTLRLRVHAWSKLCHPSDNTASTTRCTLLHGTFLATTALALGADALSVHCNLGTLAIVDFLEGALERVHHRFALLWSGGASLTATSKHRREKVSGVTAATTLLNAILTILVVQFALLFVAENLVGTLNLLELVFVTTAIRVMSPGEFEVCLLNRVEVSLLVDTENLIELRVVDFLLRASTHTGHATHLFEVSEWETTSTSSKEHFSMFS